MTVRTVAFKAEVLAKYQDFLTIAPMAPEEAVEAVADQTIPTIGFVARQEEVQGPRTLTRDRAMGGLATMMNAMKFVRKESRLGWSAARFACHSNRGGPSISIIRRIIVSLMW